MSLFKSREWWEVNLNEVDRYDMQSLLTLRLSGDEYDSILIGSHEGFLRLYSPSSDIVDGSVSGYKPSHLQLEVLLSAPILQINEGLLVSGSHEKHLAVLHPQLFSVFILKKGDALKSNIGDQVLIELAYQHVLRHTAHSFVLGPFGGIRGRSFICVQALDGLISFYEQESFAFQLILPNFILPFTFIYLDKIDSFLFLSGFLKFECYSYESLASANEDKKIVKAWEYYLGEAIVDVQTITKDVLKILVLTEQNLYGLNDNGNLLFAKRLEYKPTAFCSYLTEENSLMVLIASDQQFINFYEETNLKWSMKISQTTVCIRRIFLNQLSGGLVLLSSSGFLQCVYIGTHPSVYLVPPLQDPDVDFPKSESELEYLQNKILTDHLSNLPVTDDISVQLKIGGTFQNECDHRVCSTYVEIDAHLFISRLQVLIHVEYPLIASNPCTLFTNFSGKTVLENLVHLEGLGIPSSLTLQVMVSYITNEGIGRFINKSGFLPLDLVLIETAPEKDAIHKVTLTINKSTAALNDLFNELSCDYASDNAIGLKFVNSEDTITILAAKSSQKYRVQSDSLPAIYLPLTSLIDRLNKRFQKHSDLHLTYSSPLPLEIYHDAIRFHHKLTAQRKLLLKEVAKETSQFKIIQKKILNNAVKTTPKIASNLQKLLKYTLKTLMTTSDKLLELENELVCSRSYLSSVARMIYTILQLKNVPEDNLKLLKILLHSAVDYMDDQGILEIQQATSSFILRDFLAKSSKQQQKMLNNVLEPINDTTKLIKNLNTVIDKAIKNKPMDLKYDGPKDENSNETCSMNPTVIDFAQHYLKDPTSKSDLCLLQIDEKNKIKGENSTESLNIKVTNDEVSKDIHNAVWDVKKDDLTI